MFCHHRTTDIAHVIAVYFTAGGAVTAEIGAGVAAGFGTWSGAGAMSTTDMTAYIAPCSLAGVVRTIVIVGYSGAGRAGITYNCWWSAAGACDSGTVDSNTRSTTTSSPASAAGAADIGTRIAVCSVLFLAGPADTATATVIAIVAASACGVASTLDSTAADSAVEVSGVANTVANVVVLVLLRVGLPILMLVLLLMLLLASYCY